MNVVEKGRKAVWKTTASATETMAVTVEEPVMEMERIKAACGSRKKNSAFI